MGKVETNKKQKNTTLLQTSFELFTEKGFTKTTISDIVNRAGLAKGTFYLYFKDKYDLRDRLVTYKTSQLFGNAHTALIEQNIQGFENQMFFVIDHIIDRLEKEPKLLQFISKNLSWGIFKNAFEKTVPENSRQFYDYYQDMLTQNHISCENQELMLFTILELVGSTCYIIWEADVSPVGGIPVNIGGFHHFYAESRKNQILVINRAKFIHIKQHQVNSVMPRCQTDRFKCHIKLIIPIGFQFSQ